MPVWKIGPERKPKKQVLSQVKSFIRLIIMKRVKKGILYFPDDYPKEGLVNNGKIAV